MNVIDWLLDSDPAIRWQVMRDLTDEPPEAVRAERARVATEGWGARLLALQAPDGQWGGGTFWPEWTSTHNTLNLLRILGVDPERTDVHSAIALVRANSRWDHAGQRFFDGEVEPCINGRALAVGDYFGEDVQAIADRLLGEQMADGGWNCEQENGSTRPSVDTTINVLDGLLEHERVTGATPALTDARLRGQEYLLERRLMRRVSTGEIIDHGYAQFAFPNYWHHDVLRGLDYLRSADLKPDDRVAEAVGLVESKRGEDGRWLLDHTYPGEVHFDMDEGVGKPSRWITLRVLRILKWADQGAAR